MALEYLAITGLARLTFGGRAIVNGKGGFIQVTLELETGLADEVLVLRVPLLGRLLAEIGEQANRLQVDIEDCAGIGQQAYHVRSRAAAQQDGGENAADDDNNRDRGPELVPAISHG